MVGKGVFDGRRGRFGGFGSWVWVSGVGCRLRGPVFVGTRVLGWELLGPETGGGRVLGPRDTWVGDRGCPD